MTMAELDQVWYTVTFAIDREFLERGWLPPNRRPNPELWAMTDHSEAATQPDLTDPVVVHANMLRGTIAKPTWEQIKHLYPEQFPDAAATPSNTALPSREAIARVIFPNAFLDEHEKSPPIRIWTQAMQEAAFETADAILALFAVPSEQ
jgi:hypothetical protein